MSSPLRSRSERLRRPLRLLLTGFEPFDGEPVNPSQRLLEQLASAAPRRCDLILATSVLPVDRARLVPALRAALGRHRPDVVLALGQATGRAQIQLEVQAANAIDFRGRTDNGGHTAHGEPLHRDGPATLTSSLPWESLLPRLQDAGHPVALSRDAGRHLCNAVLYELLYNHAGLRAGFVHVPLLPDQARRRGQAEPALDECTTRAALEHLIDQLSGCVAPGHAHVAGPPGAR